MKEDVPFAEYFKLYSNYAKHDETIRAQQAELTRLRSELQQERELRKELVEVLSFYYSHGYIHGTGYDGDNQIQTLIKKAKAK